MRLLLIHVQFALHERVDSAEDVAVDCEATGVPRDKGDLVCFSRSQGHTSGEVVIDSEAVGLNRVEVANQNVDSVSSLNFDGWLAHMDAIVESTVVQDNQGVAFRSFTTLRSGHVEVQVGKVNVLEGE